MFWLVWKMASYSAVLLGGVATAHGSSSSSSEKPSPKMSPSSLCGRAGKIPCPKRFFTCAPILLGLQRLRSTIESFKKSSLSSSRSLMRGGASTPTNARPIFSIAGATA